MSGRLRALDPVARRWAVGGAVVALAASPILFLGPGNDLDESNIFRSGRSIARHLSYVPSRPPGALVHETAVGVLDLLGGTFLTNLGSFVLAAVVGVALFRLLRREGVGTGGMLAVAVVVLNPWFVIAATGTVDYVWALGFILLSAHAARSRHPVWAGLLGALAIACRVGSGLLIISILFAELGEGAEGRRRARTMALVTVGLAVVSFVPSFLSAGGTLHFAQNDFTDAGPLVLAGRTAVKDLLLLGPLGTLVALAAIPALWAALRTWRTSWLVRFATPAFVLSQLLFLRFPWKEAHLLPCLLCGAILLGVALDQRPRLLYVLVATQLLYCAVRIDVVKPNRPDQATSARPSLGIGWGPIVTDVRCRLKYPHAYLGQQVESVQKAWDCAKPFGS